MKPSLSVIVAIVSDTTERRARTTLLMECLQALNEQVDSPSLQIIVPYHDAVDGIDDVRERFPDVVLVDVPELKMADRKESGREHHDVLRARGLAVATGRLVALIEDHAKPDPHWCANIVAAHQESHAAIGGAIENGIDRPLNWAVYYCDYGRYQNPVPEGESSFASDSNVSYKMEILEAVRPAWEDSFREWVVNGALKEKGEKVVLRGDIAVFQNRHELKLIPALIERYVWGRSFAATRNVLLNLPKRLFYAALAPLLPIILLRRHGATAKQRGRHFGKFLRAAPLMVLLLASWSAGECLGYVLGIRHGPQDAHS